ncbi:MAG: TetR/AcrR family transcriptional regulator [Stenotrophobium sp.]
MPRATGKRELNKQANREAILSAARACFIDAGYDAITIRDIIRKGTLAAGTFYNYFPDKESVFRALVESRLGPVQERVHATRLNAQSIESFFYQSYLAIFEEVRADPEFFALMFRNESVMRVFYQDNIFGLIMRSLKNDTRAAITRGVFPEVDVDILTAISYGAGYELSRLLTEQPRHDPEEAARFVTRLFLDGINSLPDRARMIRIGSRILDGAAR